MPEGDTIWRTATRLDSALRGAAVVRSDLRWPSLATADLSGMTTTAVVSRGKHLLHRLDSGLTLHSHLRMEGSWHVEATRAGSGSLGRGSIRAVIVTETWTAVGLHLGLLDLVPTREESRLVGHLGPDVLGADWDPALAAANLVSASGTLGAALLDQRVLAGVGTFWAAESLFLERLDPWRGASTLSPTTARKLVDRVHRLMDAGRNHAIQSSTGEHRRGRTSHVHGRARQPCRRCGTVIVRARVGGPPQDRVLDHCPQCQSG